MYLARALGMFLQSNICDLLPLAPESKVILDTKAKDERPTRKQTPKENIGKPGEAEIVLVQPTQDDNGGVFSVSQLASKFVGTGARNMAVVAIAMSRYCCD